MRIFIDLCRGAIFVFAILASMGCFYAYANDLHKVLLSGTVICIVGGSILSFLNHLESKGSE